MADEDDRAPDLPPFTITITWAVGDSLHINTGGLTDWEAEAALNAAIDELHEAAAAEAEAEAEGE